MKLSQSTKILVLSVFIGMTNISCSGGDADDTLTIRRTGVGKGSTGNGEDGNSSKPEQAAMKLALKDKVLFVIIPTSQIKSVSENKVVFTTDFKVNGSFRITSGAALKLEIGDQSDVINFETTANMKKQKLSLTAVAQRIKNPQSEKEDDPGYLVVAFELQRDADDEGKVKSSHQLVIFNLNRVNSGKAKIKSEFLYPVPEDFELNDWVEKNLKQP